MRSLLAACALGALTAPLLAQTPCGTSGVTASATPPSAQLGQPIQISLNNGSANDIQLPSSCVITSVRLGPCEADGPPVWTPVCLQIITPVPAGTSASQTWDQTDDNGQQVPEGTYAVEIVYFDSNSNIQSCCIAVTIGSSITAYGAGCAGSQGVPALSGNGVPSAGSTINLVGSNGPPNGPALLAFGTGTGSFPLNPSCNVEIAPLIGLLVPVTLDASGGFTLPVTVPPGLMPTTITVQYLAVDVNFPPTFLTISNALAIQTS